MRKAVITLVLLLSFATVANAGELFDDYLNYVRPGTGTGPGNAQVKATLSDPVGQSFKVPKNTGEIYRIGIRPVYDTWQKNEQVTMTLYDSPKKGKKLGSYTIDWATCHVQDYVIGNGSTFKHSGDYVLYYQFRALTEGDNELYFELTPGGGDGSVSFFAFNGDAYKDGNIIGSNTTSDLAFEVDIKPVADKEANLRNFFNERLNIDHPELTAVKAAVQAEDWEKAIAETVKHFHNRTELWEHYKNHFNPSPRPDADTEISDLLLKGMIRHADTKEPIPWRAESWWMGTRPDAENRSHAFDPSPYHWHFDRHLAAGYTDTGDEKYARKCIDLRMQWILDNPNPKIVYGRDDDFPWYFELWHDRNAPARSPGHADLVYARLYNYPGWTNDEKLVLFSFFEDNTNWAWRCTSERNWLAEAAGGCMNFGIKFPEWKKSPEYRNWGANTLVELTTQVDHGDGTSNESAIKYHAMVARDLRGLLDHYDAGRVKLTKEAHAKLMKTIEGFFDHMAYTLQPDHRVVMYGDSWHEDFSGDVLKMGKRLNRADWVWIATKGKEGKYPEEVSKVYPGGGYFFMRSDFGGEGRKFEDARQLFTHNGIWYASHGHPDLLAINLYGCGRTLVIDPGQYTHHPPEGIDNYHKSRIHSMLVFHRADAERKPGPTMWASNDVVDWLDGVHYGYEDWDAPEVRRRIIFMKPNYFIVDDSSKSKNPGPWAQVWNLTDPNAKVSGDKSVETTFADGGNLIILNQDTDEMTVEEAPGITSAGDTYPKTKIVRLQRITDRPRFQTLLYPYKAGERPNIDWVRILPDNAVSDLFYSLRIKTDKELDWIVLGEVGESVTYRDGQHRVNADMVAVRMDQHGKVTSYTWVQGKEIYFLGKCLAKANVPIWNLGVQRDGDTLIVTAEEADRSLVINTLGASKIVFNGEPVSRPVVKGGMFYPFADRPFAVVADNRSGFKKITGGNEWFEIPAGYAASYFHHETDPGRHENGDFIFQVPETAGYTIQTYLPDSVKLASDRIAYRIETMGKPVEVGGAVVDVKKDDDAYVITVNHQAKTGWVTLGKFALQKGEFRINSKNMTEIDGLYYVADAMRLVRD